MSNRPVECVKCASTAVILTKETHPQTYEPFWRYTCLDCKVAWPQDQHGGAPEDYERR